MKKNGSHWEDKGKGYTFCGFRRRNEWTHGTDQYIQFTDHTPLILIDDVVLHKYPIVRGDTVGNGLVNIHFEHILVLVHPCNLGS